MKRVDPKHYTKEYYLSDATGYEEYLRTNGTQLEVRLSRIVKEIPSVKGLKVLDIGCGVGLDLYILSQHRFDVHGLDICPEMVGYARENVSDAHVSQGDFLNGSIDDVFNGVVMDAFLHLFPKSFEKIKPQLGQLLKVSSSNSVISMESAKSAASLLRSTPLGVRCKSC